MPRLAVNIVTFNSAETIDACLGSVMAQDYTDFDVTVVDNNSSDETLCRLAPWEQAGVQVIRLNRNTYFAAAHNLAIRESSAQLVMTLNPDVVLYPDFFRHIVAAFDLSPRIGSANGKLLLAQGGDVDLTLVEGPPPPDALIDSAGLMMYRSRRPYQRCNRKPWRTHCLAPASIFGADAACAVYRRSMLEAAAADGQYFDEDFVIYREDVDLAWRAQLLGWDSRYVPEAVGFHRRGFHLGRGRRSIPAHIRRHSVKNGWLLLLKNDSLPALLPDLPAFLLYQTKIALGLALLERSSLGALLDTIRLLPSTLRKRRQVQRKRRRSEAEMQRWYV